MNNEDVLVRSTMKTSDMGWLIALGVIMVIVGLALIAVNKVITVVLVLSGLAFAIGAAVALQRRIRDRQWARDIESGFLVFDQHQGERSFGDDQVLSMAIFHEKLHENGLLTGVNRRLILWLVSNDPLPEQLEMTTIVPIDTRDPLGPMISRISEKLYQRNVAELQAGRPVLGEGWHLTGNVLTVTRGGRDDQCPLKDMIAIDRVDNDLCIWRRGQDETWVKLSMESANAHLLGRLIDEDISKRPESNEPPPEGAMGRVIFERSGSKSTARAINVMGAIFLVVALIMGYIAIKNPKVWILPLLCLAGSAACAAGAVAVRRDCFRCYQYGVFRSNFWGENTLRFAEIEAFTFGATRMFVNGAYTGTTFSMSFEPLPGLGLKNMQYGVTLPHSDEELENLRDPVSRMIASRMAKRLGDGETVPWTPQLRFQPKGFEYEPAGFFGNKQPIFIPYGDVVHWDMEQGSFFIWVRGNDKAVVTQPVASRNFFPGFYLLQAMAANDDEEGAAGS